MTAPLLTVIVCTHNRATDLERLLASVEAQTVAAGSEWELLIVDNASTDRTAAVTTAATTGRIGWRVVHEPVPGLANARNRGWKESPADYVAYVDDDCVLPPGWVAAALSLLRSERPGMAGGPYEPLFLVAPPAWFKPEYGGHVLDAVRRPVAENEYLDGANWLIRRNLLERLGGFDPALGVRAAQIGYGEETEMQMRLRREFPDEKVVFDPALMLAHVVSPAKWDLRWQVRSRLAMGRAWSVLQRGQEPVPVSTALWLLPASAAAFLAEASISLLFRDRDRYPYWRGYLLERALRHVQTVGLTWERLRSLL